MFESLLSRFWGHVFDDPDKTAMIVKIDSGKSASPAPGDRGFELPILSPPPGHAALSWEYVGLKVAAYMEYLEQQGLKKGDRVAVMAWNRPEWIWVDLAVQSLGGIVVPIYPNASGRESRNDQVSYIHRLTGASFLFAQDPKQFDKVSGDIAVKKVLFQEPLEAAERDHWQGANARLAAIRAGYSARDMAPFLGIDKEQLATIIPTSGSTGDPKGVMTSHGNIAAACVGMERHGFEMTKEDIVVLYMTFAHVYDRISGAFFCIWTGMPMAFSDFEHLGQDIPVIRPTMLLGVPAVWRKMKDKVEGQLNEQVAAGQSASFTLKSVLNILPWLFLLLSLWGRKLQAKLIRMTRLAPDKVAASEEAVSQLKGKCRDCQTIFHVLGKRLKALIIRWAMLTPEKLSAYNKELDAQIEALYAQRERHGKSSLKRFGLNWKLLCLNLKGWLVTKTAPLAGRTLACALADFLVYRKIRAGFGGRLRLLMSGGAAIAQDILDFWEKIGILPLEGYGLSESTSACTANSPKFRKRGTVGKPLDGVMVEIAEDGEILISGPSIFKGYWNNPEKTAESFDAQGRFKTGDLGEIDQEGFLKIKGRKKRLMKTEGGKYVPTEKVEEKLLTHPIIHYAVPVGDGRKYIVAVLFLNQEETRKLLQEAGVSIPAANQSAFFASHPTVLSICETVRTEANKDLEHWETVKYIAVAPDSATADNGLLTTTQKIRTEEVIKRYRDLIESMYSGKERK